jgi:hypothetical protein
VSAVVCCSPGGVVLGRDDLASLSLGSPRRPGGSVALGVKFGCGIIDLNFY